MPKTFGKQKDKYKLQFLRTEENKKRQAQKLERKLNKRRTKRLAKLPIGERLGLNKNYAQERLKVNP